MQSRYVDKNRVKVLYYLEAERMKEAVSTSVQVCCSGRRSRRISTCCGGGLVVFLTLDRLMSKLPDKDPKWPCGRLKLN